ncbi:hypothetical protein R1flu_023063 [Riccia fluitans]|uniref:Uncharacterized protein n=1 Tax=Riccia fluitans TaxID=41844 RepID=A0ABD1XTX8_9MARC
MAANEAGGRQERNLTPETGDGLNLRPCLVHAPTGEIVTSYLQLSQIVKKLGWKVFMNVSRKVWGAWFLPAGDQPCSIKTVFLPHPHISTANVYQLSSVVHAFGFNTFQICYAPLRKFKELEVQSNTQKPMLRLRANGSEVLTVCSLAEIFVLNGWKKETENFFVKQDVSEKSPINLLTVIKIPAVETIDQLSTLDLEYITMMTEPIFYLESPNQFQQLRRSEAVKQQPKTSASSAPVFASHSEKQYSHTEKPKLKEYYCRRISILSHSAPEKASTADSNATAESGSKKDFQ